MSAFIHSRLAASSPRESGCSSCLLEEGSTSHADSAAKLARGSCTHQPHKQHNSQQTLGRQSSRLARDAPADRAWASIRPGRAAAPAPPRPRPHLAAAAARTHADLRAGAGRASAESPESRDRRRAVGLGRMSPRRGRRVGRVRPLSAGREEPAPLGLAPALRSRRGEELGDDSGPDDLPFLRQPDLPPSLPIRLGGAERGGGLVQKR